MNVKHLNVKHLVALSLVMATAAAGGIARAQYTPGSGGGVYSPGTPQMPQPAQPAAPQGAAYSWETPPQPQAQEPAAQPGDIRIVQPAPQIVVPRLSDGQMSDLTASIALYPDPLLATMLPATTYVEELTFADRWLAQHPGADEYAIASLPLDPSVKSIMHYPSALTLMVEHVDWTQALGVAFMNQRDDLMESIQRWRVTAVTCGTLASSPQQDVYQRGPTIVILPPPQTQVVYVPVYDPAVVYVRPLRPRPQGTYISFAAGGFSLAFIENDVDWHDHQVRVPVHHEGPVGLPPPPPSRGGPPPGRGVRETVVVETTPVPPPVRGETVVVAADPRPVRAGSTVVEVDKPVEKTVFVRDSVKPNIMYPQRITTPQPDHKVVTVTAPTTMPATMPATGPGRGRGRGPAGG